MVLDLFRVCPDYLVIFPAWFPDLAGRPLVMSVELAHNLVAGAPVMVVYETAWNRWGAVPAPCPGDSR